MSHAQWLVVVHGADSAKAEKAVAEIIKNGVQSAMNKYNGK